MVQSRALRASHRAQLATLGRTQRYVHFKPAVVDTRFGKAFEDVSIGLL
jgi:hypothetical protein